jgi:murein DD-endopeptidase MepM/ murein hydrolase activator NlpD
LEWGANSSRAEATINPRATTGDPWVRATFALALFHAAVLAVLHARPGLIAVGIWYVEPPLVTLGAAALLASAFLRSRRHRVPPTSGQLIGYLTVAAIIGSLVAFRTYPSSFDDRPSDVRFRLPLDGPVTVGWGGPTFSVNYHAFMPDQRWAYDLHFANEGRAFRNDGSRLDDYYGYGQPVLAPADGLVRTVHDGDADGPIGQWSFLRAAGNHVVLEVAPGEYLFIAHLQPGSILVVPGDRVRAGQAIGRVGNSGNSSDPHVHLHLQNSLMPYVAEGIPFYFHDYRVGSIHVERGMPYGGRQRTNRNSPASFTGQTVEHAGRH